jgi:hypothetical protein
MIKCYLRRVVMKSKLIISAVVAVFFMLAGTASATVYVNVTSEPIQYQASCDKGGGFTLSFLNTTLLHADRITIDLDFGASLCRSIDFVIAPAGDCDPGNSSVGTGWTTGEAAADVSSPVYCGDANNINDTAGGVYFHIFGNSGSQRVTMDIQGVGGATSSIAVLTDADFPLIVKFFDEKNNLDFVNPGIWSDEDGDGVYDDVADAEDNIYCINVSALDATTYRANLDSKDDKFTFEPSNPQVAHASPGVDVDIEECEKVTVGTIEIGSEVAQGGEDCTAFDFETALGYCEDTHLGDPKLILEAADPFDLLDYTVRMEILVNGESGYYGVAWTNEAVTGDGYTTVAAACGDDPTYVIGAQANYTYYDEDGGTILATSVEAPNDGDCDVSNTAEAIILETDTSDIGLASGDDVIQLDIPAMNYDLATIAAGDVVTVRVSLVDPPCKQIWQGDIIVGTFGDCVTAAVPTDLIFPYFTAMEASEAWWDGIAIVNVSGSDGTADITVYEQDGDIGTLNDVAVSAHSMYVDLLSNILGSMTADAGNTGTLGDSRCYIVVDCTFNADGFAMMGEFTYGNAQGYLPRND